jgi:hypothetical protein
MLKQVMELETKRKQQKQEGEMPDVISAYRETV